MLELYHHGSSVCAAKVRFALAEKNLDWTGHYLDILKGDQFDPEYLKLNPKAVVPTLVDDGAVITESTVICEYLDDRFPQTPLRPADPVARAKMRLWTKAVDEDLHPACAEITFASSHRHTVMRLGPEGTRRFLESTPPVSVTPDWHERKKAIVTQGLAAPGLDRTFGLYHRYLCAMDAALAAHPWVAGDEFSLADIGLAPYVVRLDMLQMSPLWTEGLPHLTGWFARIKARPSFAPTFLQWMPESLTEDFRRFGAESWPEVRRIMLGG